MSFNTERYPGVATNAPAESVGFRLNHTMLRIKDPERSLAFYTGIMGMRVLRRLDFEEMQFSLYFLARPDGNDQIPESQEERSSEKDPEVSYHDGNSEPQGFGHICFAVPNLEEAIAWFDRNGVEYVKRPEDGKIKDIAFIRDPDGYWIEILEPERMAQLGN